MRDDLLALTPDRLAVLANPGLVKRALKEVQGGVLPALEEDEDGSVLATFPDGARTRFPRHVPISIAACTCGASGLCRHRVALVLAYQALHAATAPAASEAQPWDPGQLSDAALLAFCGPVHLALAEAALQGSLLATTRPGVVPVVELPSATVQFLAAKELSAAKCDCAKRQGCEHVALAVWAFRRAPEGGLVELGQGAPKSDLPTHAAVDSALKRLATHGLTDVGAVQALAQARSAAAKAGWVWVTDALEALERQREGYARQSALFSACECVMLLAEVHARLGAARCDGPLPASYVLGSDSPAQSLLEQVRLLSLGARLEADAQRRLARIYFAEPATGTILVLEKEWTAPPGTGPKNGRDLGELFASSRMSLSSLARSELLTRAARRLANGLVDLSVARGMKSTVLSASAGWEALAEPIVVSDLNAHLIARRSRPPRFLRPRRMGGDVHVVALGEVREVTWNPGEQCLEATVSDASGAPFLLRTPHRTVAPGAVDAVASALAQAPRFVSGELLFSRDGWVMHPLALLCERLVIPDLEPPSPQRLARATGSGPAPSALDELVGQLATLVELGLLKGVSTAQGPAAALAPRLEAAGMVRFAEQVRRVAAGEATALLDTAILSVLCQTQVA